MTEPATAPASSSALSGECDLVAEPSARLADNWRTDALCREVDPELFYPPMGGSPAPALAVCSQCLARAACLSDALARRDISHGVRGGLTATQRRRILRTTLSANRRHRTAEGAAQ